MTRSGEKLYGDWNKALEAGTPLAANRQCRRSFFYALAFLLVVMLLLGEG